MKRGFYISLGSFSVALAVLGILLPGLPTTPFLLLAAWLFDRSHPELRERLIEHKILGPYVKPFLDGVGIPKKAKVYAIVLLWLTLSISMYVLAKPWAYLILSLTGLAVSTYLIMAKTRED